MKNIKIDKEKCVQCGLCVEDCVTACIEFDEDDFPRMSKPEKCISCQHCLAICPKGALTFDNLSPENSENINTKN